MTKEELFELLEIDDPSEVEYFEQLADLIETEDEIDCEDLHTALSQVSAMTMGEFAENYFDEILKALPDNAEDIYSTFSSIQQRLMMLSESLDEDAGARYELSEEIENFRDWYHNPELVEIDGNPASVFEAVFQCRADKLSGEEHEYEFINALDYNMDELVMNIGSFSKIDVVE